MTTYNDDLKERENTLGKGRVLTDGVNSTAFGDPTGEHPRFEYQYSSPVNIGARTSKMHKLAFGGAASGVPASATAALGNQYPLNDVRETVSGHVLEFNDTPGGERILIKHNSGSGVEMRPDGTIVVSALGNKVEVCGGDNTVIVEGDAKLVYKGNLTLDVTGDLNINCMDFNVNAKGDKKEDIGGSSKNTVFGNYSMKTSGHKTETVAQTVTYTYLGNTSYNIKGTYNTAVQGNVELNASGCVCTTAETEIITTTPNLNMAAKSLSVFGDTGTVGGENVIMYNYNMYTGHSINAGDTVTAPQLHFTRADGSVTHSHLVGDVTGKADNANQADFATTAGQAPTGVAGSPGSNTAAPGTASTSADTTATALPTEAKLTAYFNSSKGIKAVTVDAGDFLSNSLKEKKTTKDDIRAQLRDPANFNNAEFVSRAIGAGKLNPNYHIQVPKNGFGRIRSAQPGCERGTVVAGNQDPANAAQTFKRQEEFQRRNRTLIPDAAYNVNNQTDITINTKLAPGITMAKFLGGKSPSNFKNLPPSLRKQLARNYYLHSQIIKYVMTRPGPQATDFEDYRLEVVEGFYQPARYGVPSGNSLATEVLTPNSALDKRNKGTLVVYELIDQYGEQDADATFELASYLRDKCSHLFDKLTLDYDEYDPDGTLNIQLMIEVPNVSTDYSINSQGKVETIYNGKVQGKNSLIEILPTDGEKRVQATVPTTETTVDESRLINRREAELRAAYDTARIAYENNIISIELEEAKDQAYAAWIQYKQDNNLV